MSKRVASRSTPRPIPRTACCGGFPYRRLEVEAIRDSMLAVSGQLEPRRCTARRCIRRSRRRRSKAHSDPDTIWKPFDERDASRRTIYVFVKRSLVVPMLEVLDFCDTTRSIARSGTSRRVAPQALTLFNGDFVNRQARHFAARLHREAGDDPAKQIELRLPAGPVPAADGRRAAAMRPVPRTERARPTPRGTSDRRPNESRRAALAQLCRVIFNLNEFVYPD